MPAACALTLAACAGRRANPQAAQEAARLAPEEKLGVDDVFEVRVLGEPDLSGAFRVTADGNVDYPLAGRLKVGGLNTGEVQQLITEKLKDGYLKSPQVTVMIKEWNSRKIIVVGQVQKPGPVSYYPRMTIVEAIAAAGDFTGIAAKNSVRLTRKSDGTVVSLNVAVADIREGRKSNVEVLPGDYIVVEERLF